jgi:hypothetical protein
MRNQTLAMLRPWVIIKKATATANVEKLTITLDLQLLGQSPPANLEFSVFALAVVPKDPHDFVILGPPPRNAVCPAKRTNWTIAPDRPPLRQRTDRLRSLSQGGADLRSLRLAAG